MSIKQEEIFGPVVTAAPLDTIDEVVRLADNSRYGPAAGDGTARIGAVGALHRPSWRSSLPSRSDPSR